MQKRNLSIRKRIVMAGLVFLLPVGAWGIAVRWAGPMAGPIPQDLPHWVRRPPPLMAEFPPGETFLPDKEIRDLHAQGIRGRHIGIAIVDRPLLVEHREYTERLRWYDEIDCDPTEPAGWHATAVASLAAGSNVGIAPEADLYFVGVGMMWSREPMGNWFTALRHMIHYGQTLPMAIRRILECNRRLPADRKIRALSLSVGGGSSFLQAVEEARREGLFVAALDLHVPPVGPVTFASPASPSAYTAHKIAAGSWGIARLAGRYALACQVDPQITPERFLRQLKNGVR